MNKVYVIMCKDFEGKISVHGVYSSQIMAEKFLNKFKEEYSIFKEIEEYISKNSPSAPGYPRKRTEAALHSYSIQHKRYAEQMEKFNLFLLEKFGDNMDLFNKYKGFYFYPESYHIKGYDLDDEFIKTNKF